MQASELTLEGDFQPEKTYLLKGSTIRQWQDALTADRIIPGPDQKETQTKKGRVITGGEAGAGAAACPLGSIGTDGKITPGWFIGGGKNEIITPAAITPAAGKKVWIKVTWTAEKIDEVLQAGGTAGTISIHSGTGSVPADDVPNISSLTGTAYYALGYWDDALEFVESGCGTITIDFCPGGFTKARQS